MSALNLSTAFWSVYLEYEDVLKFSNEKTQSTDLHDNNITQNVQNFILEKNCKKITSNIGRQCLHYTLK